MPGDMKYVKCSACKNSILSKKLGAEFLCEVNLEHNGTTYQVLSKGREICSKSFRINLVNSKPKYLKNDVDITFSNARKVILSLQEHVEILQTP